MKKLLFLLTVFFFSSCSQTINYDEEKEYFEKRNEITYYKGRPFTGTLVSKNLIGKLLMKITYKEGYKDGLYESYFSWREVPITPQQLLQYVNFRSEMAKWTEEGYVNASTILSEMKKWP